MSLRLELSARGVDAAEEGWRTPDPDASPSGGPEPSGGEPDAPAAEVAHLELARLIERLHRRYLDLMRLQLNRLGADDVSPAQVMVLFTVGTGEISVGELLDRGHYLGPNASYNLKRLVEAGYLERRAAPSDRRLARLRLSERGQDLCRRLRDSDQAYQGLISGSPRQASEVRITDRTLRRLEWVWTDALRYGAI